MQTVSELYRALYNAGADMEIRADIAGVSYYMNDTLISVRTRPRLFGKAPTVGSVTVGELNMSVLADTDSIPRASKIELYARLTDGTRYSEWIRKGVFFIHTRKYDRQSGVLTIHGYDALAKAGADFAQSGDQGRWPMADIAAVDEICRRIGVSLDSRTRAILTRRYLVQYPGYGEDAYSLRDTLGFVGSMYAGNWIIADTGELRLVLLGDIPDETHYLIEEHGDVILIGGVRILV